MRHRTPQGMPRGSEDPPQGMACRQMPVWTNPFDLSKHSEDPPQGECTIHSTCGGNRGSHVSPGGGPATGAVSAKYGPTFSMALHAAFRGAQEILSRMPASYGVRKASYYSGCS